MRIKNWNLFFGFCITLSITLLAIFASHLSPIDPNLISLKDELAFPSWSHPLGCDSNGSDILSIILHGARLSLKISILVTIISVFIGLIVGSIAGYYGGWRDTLLMRILDIIFAFPGIILAIALATMLGPSEWNMVLCLVATGWAGYARLVRGEVQSIRNQEFVEAARAMGLPDRRIFLFHLWPNIISPILVTATYGLAGTILAEASLSFLGIGVPPGTPSWGYLLSFGRDVLLEAPHVATFPGIAIMVTVFGFHLLGEGLRYKLDPKARR